MAYCSGSIVGPKQFLLDFFVSGAIVAGQLVVSDPTTTNLGEVTNPAGTGSGGATDIENVYGIASDAATSNTAPTIEPVGPLTASLTLGSGLGLENIVRVECNPFAIYRFPIAGGTSSATALATTAPANIIVITTAGSKTVLTATGTVGTIDMTGGLVKGAKGANAGSRRKMTAFSSATSQTVGIGFLNNTVVGDTFIRVPYSRQMTRTQMTTDFTAMNGIIACNNAGAVAAHGVLRVYNVGIDEVNSVAWVEVMAADHFYNPNQAM